MFLSCVYLGAGELTSPRDAWDLYRLAAKFQHTGKGHRSARKNSDFNHWDSNSGLLPQLTHLMHTSKSSI